MVKCCVVGCTSGYKSNTEKVHQFCVPKNEDFRIKWAKAIPRQDLVFTKNTYVCAKHFNEDDIIKFWCSGDVKVSYLIFVIFFLNVKKIT